MTSSSVGQGWEAQVKGPEMMGVIYVRCESCGELSYDPRTGKCEDEPTRPQGRSIK